MEITKEKLKNNINHYMLRIVEEQAIQIDNLKKIMNS